METSEALEIMAATPKIMGELLRLDESALRRSGKDGWTAKEYLGHLCDAIERWDERIRLTLAEDNPFLAGYDQEGYVRDRNHQEADLTPTLAHRAALRAETMDLLNSLSEEQWQRTATHAERGLMTMRQIVERVALHEQGHLNDIQRTVAESTPQIAKIVPAQKLSLFDDYWQPRVVGELNDSEIKLVKVKGEFVWHHHENEDELFIVLKGQLVIRLPNGEVTLNEGEMVIIPRGVEHQPYAAEEVHLVLLEPKNTLNTGNVQNERTVAAPQSI